MGQILSTIINPFGFLICATTPVYGNSSGYTATDGGKWIVYQSGRQVATLPGKTVTMKNVQSKLFFALLVGGN